MMMGIDECKGVILIHIMKKNVNDSKPSVKSWMHKFFPKSFNLEWFNIGGEKAKRLFKRDLNRLPREALLAGLCHHCSFLTRFISPFIWFTHSFTPIYFTAICRVLMGLLWKIRRYPFASLIQFLWWYNLNSIWVVDQAHVPAAFPWKFDGIGTHMGQTAAKITQFL